MLAASTVEWVGGIGSAVAAAAALIGLIPWRRRRDRRRRRSNLEIDAIEYVGHAGGGELVIGETRHLKHTLTIGVINRGEAAAFAAQVWLEPERSLPLRVKVHDGPTREVGAGNRADFVLEIDGRQAFPWDERFRVAARTADGRRFHSPYAALGQPPQHDRKVVIPYPYAVPDNRSASWASRTLPPGATRRYSGGGMTPYGGRRSDGGTSSPKVGAGRARSTAPRSWSA